MKIIHTFQTAGGKCITRDPDGQECGTRSYSKCDSCDSWVCTTHREMHCCCELDQTPRCHIAEAERAKRAQRAAPRRATYLGGDLCSACRDSRSHSECFEDISAARGATLCSLCYSPAGPNGYCGPSGCLRSAG